MTKTHFKRIAEALAKAKDPNDGRLSHEQVVDILVCVFSDINPKFDYQRWDDACNGRQYKK